LAGAWAAAMPLPPTTNAAVIPRIAVNFISVSLLDFHPFRMISF
jgi:hypothetical protein